MLQFNHEDTKTRSSAISSCLRAFVVKARIASSLAAATLREIFDEAAYQRFLDRRNLAACRSSYAEFLAESRALRERRPRCC